MNNFRKYCAHECPLAGGGGGRANKKMLSLGGGGAFSTLKGALFFIWKAFFLLLEALFLIFGGHFLHMGDLIFFYVEKFLGLSQPTKLSAGPHALTAKLIHVCEYVAFGKLREIVRFIC